MRIAYLINQYPAISHSFIRREILALEQRGFEILRISIRGWNRELVDEADREERKRTRYVLRNATSELPVAALRILLTRPVRFLRALRTAWHMSRCSERPLHIHLIYVAEACRIELWLRDAGIKHLHAHFGSNSAEVAMLVHILGGPPWSFTAHGIETFDNPQLVGLTAKVLHSTFVVAVSSYGRAQVYRSVPPEHWHKVHVVHCGLDPAFRDAPGSVTAPPRRIVCVGRLSAEKGHLVLLQASRQLAQQGVDFELILAGDGELRPELESQISEYGLLDKVKITGWVTGAQVRAEILASRALVLASFGEGMPVVLMEAMALRRPVIATFIAGIPELVRQGVDGWLVPAGDIVGLANALRACLDAPLDLVSRMGDRARERVLARHDVNIAAAKLDTLFRSDHNELSTARQN